MLKVKIPATSANIRVGFDTLGIALNIYNEFTADVSNEYNVKGFKKEFNNESNLVLKSYQQFASTFLNEDQIKKVSITLTSGNIPVSRGLGSSATCILAGVIIANEINNLKKTLHECASIASDIETHPDNVFAAAFGNLTAAFKTKDGYHKDTFKINQNYHFTVLSPETKGSTEELRNALSKQVSLEDTVFHISRIIHIPKAFEQYNFKLLKELLQDRIHETKRLQFIPKHEEITKLNENNNMIACVSGSGSSILIISTESIVDNLNHLKGSFKITETTISNGCQIEVD